MSYQKWYNNDKDLKVCFLVALATCLGTCQCVILIFVHYRQTSTLAMHKRTAHGDDSSIEAETALLLQQADDGNYHV